MGGLNDESRTQIWTGPDEVDDDARGQVGTEVWRMRRVSGEVVLGMGGREVRGDMVGYRERRRSGRRRAGI